MPWPRSADVLARTLTRRCRRRWRCRTRWPNTLTSTLTNTLANTLTSTLTNTLTNTLTKTMTLPAEPSAEHGARHVELPEALQRWQPTLADPFDRQKAAHLLRRAGFGGTPTEVEQAVARGMDSTVDLLLDYDGEGPAAFGTRVLANGEMLEVARDLDDQRAAWLHDMVHGDAPLREKLTLFWHDHWSVGGKYGSNRSHLMPHLSLLRRHGRGPLAGMFRAMLRDPAMLIWLDNWSNGRPEDGRPRVNLNFSRELFELYTMGRDGGYTQADVEAAAACLSGHGLVMGLTTNAAVYRPGWHVPGPKRVLGRVIDEADGARDALVLIDTALAWPRTAQWLAAKIWRFLVGDPPPAELLGPLAEWWRARALDVGALLDCLLRSRAFYGPQAVRRLIKSPVELVVGALRQLQPVPVASWRELGRSVGRMGWRLLDYYTPAGLPDGAAWLSLQGLMERARFAHAVAHEMMDDGALTAAVDDALRLAAAGERGGRAAATWAVTALIDRLVAGSGTLELVPRYAALLGSDFASCEREDAMQRLRRVVYAILASPEYQVS